MYIHKQNGFLQDKGGATYKDRSDVYQITAVILSFEIYRIFRLISRGQFLALKMRVFPYDRLISRIRKAEKYGMYEKYEEK